MGIRADWRQSGKKALQARLAVEVDTEVITEIKDALNQSLSKD